MPKAWATRLIMAREINAISNCTEILQAPPHSLTPSGALAALQELSIYTNAESCPMCASAIRFSAFKEYIFGTSIPFLTDHGACWSQITLSSYNIFQQSVLLGTSTQFVGNILGNETDPMFAWQFDESAPCPSSCVRTNIDATPTCVPTKVT
ncbi:hypothetical protein PHLGIDRAFT_510279 [Phlebiopsis gigantea 11061_1 CR5-6]|uniref:CMP/dCMP-type deaminase domain-containing protein n=1 Tax=Phlebiopsis gigantea (strain 11061_1 CR5-6) TaxID=745531 RepID=A0A0C3P278_PHLG1|nr:hypothetical protein PHLGIDRAFT_510279 [Phlebiopsis gigantea 11061_1 CR5-6]